MNLYGSSVQHRGAWEDEINAWKARAERAEAEIASLRADLDRTNKIALDYARERDEAIARLKKAR